MPSGDPRSIRLWKEDIALTQDMRENCKKRKHSIKHWGALKLYGYNLTTLPIIIGQSGSQYQTTTDALAKIGRERGPASKVMSKLHEHELF